MDTYSETIKCSNCGHREAVAIPKGETKQTFCAMRKCANCGCAEMKPDTSVPRISYRTEFPDDPSFRPASESFGKSRGWGEGYTQGL